MPPIIAGAVLELNETKLSILYVRGGVGCQAGQSGKVWEAPLLPVFPPPPPPSPPFQTLPMHIGSADSGKRRHGAPFLLVFFPHTVQRDLPPTTIHPPFVVCATALHAHTSLYYCRVRSFLDVALAMDGTATDAAATATPTPDVAFDVEISDYDAPTASESSCGGVTQPIRVSVPWTDDFAAATCHLLTAAAEAAGRDPSDLAVCSYPEGEAWTDAVWEDDRDSWTHVARRVYSEEPAADERHRLLTKVYSRRIRVDDAACVRARAALAADGHALGTPDTALHAAVAAGDAALARRWIAAGVGVDVPGPFRRRPLAAAAHASPDPATVTLLLEGGAAVGAKELSGATALHWAAHEGRLENVRALVAAGASADMCTRDGESPLQYAVLNRHDAVAKHLLTVGGARLEKPRDNPAGLRLAETYSRLRRSCAPGDAVWLALNPGKTPPTQAELVRMQRERALEAAVTVEDYTEAARLKQLIRATEKEALAAEAAGLQTGSEEGTSGSWSGFVQSVETLTMTGPASSGSAEGVVVSSECLGRGSFGSVYKGYDLASGEHVAVKRICNLAPAKMDKINREVLIMGKLRHPNVVRYLGSALNEAVPFLDIYMELMASSLQELIEKIHADDARLENIVWETRVVGQQVLSGLAHLHDENVAHRVWSSSHVHTLSLSLSLCIDTHTGHQACKHSRLLQR